MSPSPYALDISGLRKSFDRPVVIDLELKVKAGEFYALLGPNGAGKTTILGWSPGLLKPDAGSISVLRHRHGHRTPSPPSRSSPGSPTSPWSTTA